MNHIEIENLIVEKEKELAVLHDNLSTVEQEKLHIQRSILELQLQKKDLEMSIDKAKNALKQKNIELSLLNKRFWSEKRSGN